MSNENTVACYEIAIDGTPRSWRDSKHAHRGSDLKTKQTNSEVIVRDIETGEMITIKHPLQSR